MVYTKFLTLSLIMNPFDKYAKEYDKWFDENKIIYESEIEAIKKHILNAGDELVVVGYENDIVDFKKVYKIIWMMNI